MIRRTTVLQITREESEHESGRRYSQQTMRGRLSIVWGNGKKRSPPLKRIAARARGRHRLSLRVLSRLDGAPNFTLGFVSGQRLDIGQMRGFGFIRKMQPDSTFGCCPYVFRFYGK